MPSDFIDVEHGLVDRKIFTVFNARFIRAAIRDKLQEGAIAVEEATADLRKQRGVTLRSTLDRHTNDHMVSFYMATPSGFEVEFGTGAHALIWNASASSASRPNFEFVDQYKRKFGEERSRWMTETTRNLLLFPNVFLMDQVSTQVRIVRPISVDETEITTYCIAPVGESARARAMRIRQYEDFFNASGMATPDDLTEFNNCQIAYGRDGGRYNDLSRGATRSVQGSGKFGKGLNIDATMSSINVADEGLFVTMHKEWIERMKHAIAQERAEASLTRENDRSRAAE